MCCSIFQGYVWKCEKPSNTFQTFAQYSLLYINIGMSDATEEIWKTPPALGSHKVKIIQNLEVKIFLFLQLKVMT